MHGKRAILRQELELTHFSSKAVLSFLAMAERHPHPSHERKINLVVVLATLAVIAALVAAAVLLVGHSQPVGGDAMDNIGTLD